jgi:hypothetical protein
MLNINFDLFYELKIGSVVSISRLNEKLDIASTSYYRISNNTLEIKNVDDVHDKSYDWHKCDCISFHPDSVFKIEERNL